MCWGYWKAEAEGRPAVTWFGGPPRSGFFYKTSQRSFASSKTSPGSRRRPPRRRCPPSLRFLNSARFRKGVDCVSLLPGTFSSLGHPSVTATVPSSQKIAKGHAFAVRQPSDSSLFSPSSILFTNFFTTPLHLSRLFPLPCLCGAPSGCSHRSLSVPQTSSGPAVGA